MSRRLQWLFAAAAIVAGAFLAAKLLWPTEVPDDLRLSEPDPSRFFTAAELEEARDYGRFLGVTGLLSTVALVGALAFYAARGERFVRESAAGRIGTGMLLGMLGFAIVWLAQLPFGLVQLWWERRHDVSKLGYLDWIIGSWLGLAGIFLFVCLAILIVMALAGPLRERWWIAGAPAFVALGLAFAFVSPFLIPDLHSLRDDGLAADARRLARAEGESKIPVRVQEVEEFTTAPNAEAAGLGSSRRIILWDTLLRPPFDRDEVRFVLAHELGHHSRDHILKGFGWSALIAFPLAFAIAVATRRRGGMYEARAVPLALLVVVVLQLALAPLQNVVSRRYEAEADWVALQTTREPDAAAEAFEELARTSLSDPQPPTFTYVWEARHPSIMERIAMTQAWKARSGRAAR